MSPRSSPRPFPVLRLIGLFALLGIVPLAALSYFTIHLADRAVVREVRARVRTTAAVTATLLQQQMQAVADLTASYARRPVLVNALGDGNLAHFDDEAVDRQLTELHAAVPGSGGVFVTDASCRLSQVQPATPAIVGVDFSYRDWCRGATATGRPYVSEAYRTTITGNPLVVAAAVMVRDPAGDDAGGALGLIAVVYKLDTIRQFADQLAQAQGVHLTIGDQRGTVLVGSTSSTDATGLASATADPRVREALNGRAGVVRSTTANGDALSAYAPVGTIGWTVTAEVPAWEALAGVRQLRSTVMSLAVPLGLVLLGGVIVLARTLRLRREAERTLTEREAQTRAILDAATDAFVSMDAAGNIIGWNGQAERLFGWSEPEALGRLLSETIIPSALREGHERGLAHFLSTGEGPVLNQRIEIRALHRDGHVFPAELAIWTVRAGETWTFNGLVHDITERKRAEADVAAARDQALQASQMKSEFLANMSHEIRTPMNGVLGMTSLLLDTDLNDDQRAFAETVRGSGEGLLSILNDILDFSKIEAGRLELESIDFDLRGLVDDVAGLLSLPADAKGIEMTCSLPVDVPATVRGDPGRIRQILTNLVGNAVKFTSSGEVRLEMTMSDADVETAMLRFQVVDTGIGIAHGDQAAMFESFSQADAGTTRRYGGTGLGLAISRQLVELMGGQIGVLSGLGEGSTFWFTIPVERGHPVAAVTRAGLAGLRMLIVDDNATNRVVLTRFLHSWNIRSHAVEGGGQALDALVASAAAGDPFDAALLDLNMPGMDGIELAQCVAADGAIPPVRLVLLTSSGQRGEAGRAREAGITAYQTKPVRQVALYDCLATVMGAPAAAAADPADLSAVGPGSGRPGRILLVEDNGVNRLVATSMLERLGFGVEVAANGDEAVKLASGASYDVILMDCQMPVMDGYEATAGIRRMEAGLRRTPIVAVTASAMRSDEERCLAAGMDDYLSKPYSLKSLAAALARWAPDGQVGAPATVESELAAVPAALGSSTRTP